ncbi:hypothetical protein CC117_25585 [Parafrankia colletiae]|uniref:Protein-L-isoaspartate O-methyltransferase n=1 Tax=Parafrankia colletiae TaxID=573497 RepID=A0A1S1Q9R8_9ACTN|nr:hypothetical protein [Parafrankia colletiae]MCK9904183.1 methyltransferase, FxLD system [Frankia sp. Cpl3]OHV31593.1 hypothetical protein CC117_25585 [Parafrankia colletiae]
MSSGAAGTSTVALRAAMVEQILAATPVSAPVEAALRAVPRHRFLPDLPIEEAYADRAVARPGSGRRALAPSTIATMLDQLGVLPGDRVLEVGAADGYSTALLAELTGPAGVVLTTDVNPTPLHERPGHLNIVVAVDLQARPHMPFDRVLAHAGVDLRPALIEEVSEGGRLVIPLRLRGLDRTVGFVHNGGRLVSESIRAIHVAPRGARRTAAFLAGGVRLDGAGHDVDARQLRHALREERHLISTGVTLPTDLLAGLDLWLAIIRQTYGRLYIDAVPDQQHPLGPPSPHGVSATWTDDSIAFLDIVDTSDTTAVEILAAAYGPDRHRAADLLAYDVQIWDARRREGPDPTLRIHPTSTVCELPSPGQVITTPDVQILITWDWPDSPPQAAPPTDRS